MTCVRWHGTCVCVHMGITVAVKRAPLKLAWCGRVCSVLSVQYTMHRNSLEHTTVHKPSTTYAMHRNGLQPFHNIFGVYRNALQAPQWPASLPQHFGILLQCTIWHHKLPKWSGSFLQRVSSALHIRHRNGPEAFRHVSAVLCNAPQGNVRHCKVP